MSLDFSGRSGRSFDGYPEVTANASSVLKDEGFSFQWKNQ
jgi:hypothetical protein